MYNWKQQRSKKAFLALENGSCFYGFSIGAPTNKLGEVVFNTGLARYQEIISDHLTQANCNNDVP